MAIDDRPATLGDVTRIEEKLENKIDKLENKLDKTISELNGLKVTMNSIDSKIEGFLKGQSVKLTSVAAIAAIIGAVGVIGGFIVSFFN